MFNGLLLHARMQRLRGGGHERRRPLRAAVDAAIRGRCGVITAQYVHRLHPDQGRRPARQNKFNSSLLVFVGTTTDALMDPYNDGRSDLCNIDNNTCWTSTLR